MQAVKAAIAEIEVEIERLNAARDVLVRLYNDYPASYVVPQPVRAQADEVPAQPVLRPELEVPAQAPRRNPGRPPKNSPSEPAKPVYLWQIVHRWLAKQAVPKTLDEIAAAHPKMNRHSIYQALHNKLGDAFLMPETGKWGVLKLDN